MENLSQGDRDWIIILKFEAQIQQRRFFVLSSVQLSEITTEEEELI
jgi:hypothetical protein